MSARESACPNWCTQGTEERPCRGVHFTSSDFGYISATAGLPTFEGDSEHGAEMMAVTTGLAWEEAWGRPMHVYLHVAGHELDVQVDMHLHEAAQLLAALSDMVGRAVRAGHILSVGGNDENPALLSDMDCARQAFLDAKKERERFIRAMAAPASSA